MNPSMPFILYNTLLETLSQVQLFGYAKAVRYDMMRCDAVILVLGLGLIRGGHVLTLRLS
jgi:hypothetical protein